MVNYICTRFKDSDGLDLGCHLIPKEYLLEKYPAIQEWVKAPALWIWGNPNFGLLGNNTAPGGSVGRASSPIQTISGGTNWRSASTGQNHAIAIKTDGTLWAWGFGTNAVLGTNSVVSVSSPVQTVSGGTNWKQASAGGNHSAAIKTDGTLWIWGLGASGILGNNAVTNRSSPVQTISGGTNWKNVSAGGGHTNAIKTDGTLWSWGYGSYGRLGNNFTYAQSSPVQTISSGTNWKSVSAGTLHSVAIKTDGTLWIWGCGGRGLLGNESALNMSSPVQTVGAGNNWKQASAGASHTAAIKTDGTLWTWGFNLRNQLGLGDGVNFIVSSPVQTISGGTNWKQVSAKAQTTAAIKTDGTLWIWGAGFYGMHGDNTYTIQRGSPVQTVSAGNNWRLVETGCKSTVAIRDEGDF